MPKKKKKNQQSIMLVQHMNYNVQFLCCIFHPLVHMFYIPKKWVNYLKKIWKIQGVKTMIERKYKPSTPTSKKNHLDLEKIDED